VKVLVLLEHAGGGLLRGSAGVLAQAARLAEGPVAAVLTGPASGDGADRAVNAAGIVDGARSVDMDALAVEAGRCGAAKVYLARADVLDPPLPQPHVDVMERVVVEGGYDTVLLSNSVLAADVASGLAARLGAGLNWDLVEMAASGGELTAKRLAFQD
jgi:electron transfer flavoprotein alpha subunit